MALIVKHLAGNLTSRWSDFLTTDGDKPTRDRDSEFFLTPADTRASLLARWERGLGDAVHHPERPDRCRSGEDDHDPWGAAPGAAGAGPGATHAAYHIGQILYLARLLNPEGKWLTIPPGQSQNVGGAYLK